MEDDNKQYVEDLNQVFKDKHEKDDLIVKPKGSVSLDFKELKKGNLKLKKPRMGAKIEKQFEDDVSMKAEFQVDLCDIEEDNNFGIKKASIEFTKKF